MLNAIQALYDIDINHLGMVHKELKKLCVKLGFRELFWRYLSYPTKKAIAIKAVNFGEYRVQETVIVRAVMDYYLYQLYIRKGAIITPLFSRDLELELAPRHDELPIFEMVYQYLSAA